MKIEEVFARRRFIMLDGAMGTQLQLRGLTTEQKPELAAFIMPDVLTAVHRDYARAGADILLANTFGANPRKLKGTGYTVQQVIEASIACARTAAQETGALVALDIGPIGELLARAQADGPVRSCGLLVGSEGGLTPEEVALAADCGVGIASLGPRILRCETAPLAAAAVVMYLTGNL